MKDFIQTKFAANTGQVSDVNEFSGVDKKLKLLRGECRNKDKIIKILLENLFEREIINVSYKDNSVYVLHTPRFTCSNSNELQVFNKSRSFTNRNKTR